MKVKTLFSTLLACTLLLTSCQQPAPASKEVAPPVVVKPDLSQIKSEIQALENSWADAMNTKSIPTLMALYGDDAITMPADASMISGKAAIQKYQEAEFAKNTTNNVYAFETLDVFAGGDFVTEVGKSIIKDPAGKIVNTGKYMAVYEKRNGKYVCIREIYNNDEKMK